MSIKKLVAGDANDLRIPLFQADGTPEVDISAATSVEVALEKSDRSARLAGPYFASSTYADANWAAALVVVPVPADDLGAIIDALPIPNILIHVRVVIAGKATHYYTPLTEILRGWLP